MKSQKTSTHSSRSYRSWIAGILLTIACVLFISICIHDRWTVVSSTHRHFVVMYTGIWHRKIYYNKSTVTFKIRCLNEKISCTNFFAARVFMIATCITSGIGAIILCILPILKTKHKSILCLTGLCMAILSFIFGMIGSIFGLIWAFDGGRHTAISSGGISVLIGTFLSFISGVCVFIINLNESM